MKSNRKADAGRRGTFALGLLVVSLLAAGGGVLALASSTAPSPGGVTADRLDPVDRAKIAFAGREFARAEKLVREILSRSPGFLEAKILLGRVLVERGRLIEARDLFAEILKAEPENYEGLRGMAGALRGLRQLDLAQVYLRKAADLRKEDPEVWKSLGLLQRERGDALGALSSFQQSLRLDGNQSDMSAMLGDLVTGKDALAGTSSSPSRGFGVDPMNPRPIDPDTIVPRPRPPDPSQFFPKPQGRNR